MKIAIIMILIIIIIITITVVISITINEIITVITLVIMLSQVELGNLACPNLSAPLESPRSPRDQRAPVAVPGP